MTHRLWLPLALVALMTGTAHAQVAPGWGRYGPAVAPARQAPAQQPGAEAAATVKAGMDKLLDFLGQRDAPNKLQAAAFLDREIAPYFDFAYMAQWVAGPAWADKKEEERKALAATIESSLLSTLASQMARYDGQQVRYLRPRPGPSGSVKVPVAILRPGAYPANLTFRTYRSADGWKVYDVEANGRSVAAYYRTQMSKTGQPVPAQAAVPTR
jgi:phospholipid transport system substrate-binding protein